MASWIVALGSEAPADATWHQQGGPLSSSLTSLNETTTIDEVVQPPKPKRKRVRAQEKRHPSQGERPTGKRKGAAGINLTVSLTQQ